MTEETKTEVTRRKPGPKPKVDRLAESWDGIPFRGGENPEKAEEAFLLQAEAWSRFNDARADAGVHGLDGELLELAFIAIGVPSKASLTALADFARYAATRVSA